MPSQCCPRCGDETKLRYRSFSEQALAALVTWGEIDRSLIAAALCEVCYGDLRETLIDRVEELAAAAAAKPAKPRKVSRPPRDQARTKGFSGSKF